MLSGSGAQSASAEPVFTVPVPPGGGPAATDEVFVQRFGAADASTVLVLTPGAHAGAGAFTLLARDLVARAPDVQVWATDRREHGFEDTSVLALGDPGRAIAYYLQGEPVDGRTFAPPSASSVGYMADWGLGRLVEDLRAVVRRARAGGRRVVLGGHSLGAAVAQAYAMWDFGGRAGARDLAGLVLIDGALRRRSPSLAHARAELEEYRARPRDDVFNRAAPWTLGVLTAIAGQLASTAPEAVSPLTGPLIPPALTPPFAVTNESWLGLAQQALFPVKRGARAHAGKPAGTGDPRPWRDGDITPIARLAAWATGTPLDTVDWYTPRRLLFDVDAAMRPNRARLFRLLSLRATRPAAVTVPLLAFTTATDRGTVRALSRYVGRTRIAHAVYRRDRRMTHTDPLTAAPPANTLLPALTRFLKRL